MRLIAFGLVFLLACDLTSPGDPVPLTSASVTGKWELVQRVLSSTSPILSDTKEITQNGTMYEFTRSGGAQEFCRCGGIGPPSPVSAYSISGDTLRLQTSEQPVYGIYLVEVWTHELILRDLGTFPYDINGDGVLEDVTLTRTFKRMND